MTTRIIDGRLALDREGVAERADAGESTVRSWWQRRATTGFPDALPADVAGQHRPLWWWADEVDTFLEEYRTAQGSKLTQVDTSGDPDELVNAGQATKILGYRRPVNLPEEFLKLADHTEELPSGRIRRFWKRSTVWEFGGSRSKRHGGGPGPGAGRGGRRSADQAVDRTGDPDELVGSAEAARVLGYSMAQSLPAAVRDRADQVTQWGAGRAERKWKRSTLWAYADEQGF